MNQTFQRKCELAYLKADEDAGEFKPSRAQVEARMAEVVDHLLTMKREDAWAFIRESHVPGTWASLAIRMFKESLVAQYLLCPVETLSNRYQRRFIKSLGDKVLVEYRYPLTLEGVTPITWSDWELWRNFPTLADFDQVWRLVDNAPGCPFINDLVEAKEIIKLRN